MGTIVGPGCTPNQEQTLRLDKPNPQVSDQVWVQVWFPVWDQVLDRVRDQVWDQVWDQVRYQAALRIRSKP
jgi:hypothetical protein